MIGMDNDHQEPSHEEGPTVFPVTTRPSRTVSNTTAEEGVETGTPVLVNILTLVVLNHVIKVARFFLILGSTFFWSPKSKIQP